jgi:hypothetical protein
MSGMTTCVEGGVIYRRAFEAENPVFSSLRGTLFGGRRVAMRVDDGPTDVVYYLHGDHLGSTSLTTDSSGDIVAEQRYLRFAPTVWRGALDE